MFARALQPLRRRALTRSGPSAPSSPTGPLLRPRRFNPTPARRHASRQTTPAAVRALFRRYPVSMAIASVSIVGASAGILYSNYIYKTYMLDQYAAYPAPVAVKLRRALYYSNIAPDPHEAMRYYREALVLCAQHAMSPLSNEVLGIRFQMVALLERIQLHPKAIALLELIRAECRSYIDDGGWEAVPDGRKSRTRVLGKLVGINMKLGELYAGEYVGERERAEERLVEAVETVLTERRRRQDEGVRADDEGEWMADGEIVAALEALAAAYEHKGLHYLATPLLLQALTLAPAPPDCHAVVLMNNLAASLAQSSPVSPISAPNTPPASRAQLVASARAWAEKALEVAANVKPPVRTSECDEGCAVATYNLGEFLEMDGDARRARRRYEEAEGLARAMGFEEGVGMAREGLKRLEKGQGTGGQ